MDLMQWCPDFSNYWPSRLFPFQARRAARSIDQNFLAAIQSHNLEAVKAMLLLNLVNPNVQYVNFRRRTPLHIACGEGALEIARCLLDAGADPNVADETDITPLMLAAFKGSVGLVRELLFRQAFVAGTDNSGSTALNYALAGARCEEVLTVLLASGAAEDSCERLVSSWGDDGASIEQLALEALRIGGRVPVSDCRLVRDHVIRRAVVCKAAEGREDLLAAAAKQGVQLDFVVDFDWELKNWGGSFQFPQDIPASLRSAKDGTFRLSPVVAAVLQDNQAVLQLLQSLGVPLDRRDRLGFTPVFVAAAMGRLAALAFLLASKCSAAAKSHSGLTAVHLCALHCPPEAALPTLQLLIRRGAPADNADPSGRTPAEHFMNRGLLEPLRFLAGHRGCNPHRTLSPHGVSLLEFAVRSGWDAEVRLRLQLRGAGGRANGATVPSCQLVDAAVESGQRRVLETLFAIGCWPEDTAATSSRLVQAAVSRCDAKMLWLLATRLGADVDAIDTRTGETALTQATLDGQTDRVQMLLALGADPLRTNATGLSAMALAERIDDQEMFMRLTELMDAATPALWPVPSGTSESVAKAELSVAECQVLVPILGRGTTFRVVEYRATFAEPVDLFRKARRGELPVLAEILADLGRRLPQRAVVTLRAFAGSGARQQQEGSACTSVDWPEPEYLSALTCPKLRELMCHLHWAVAVRRCGSCPAARERSEWFDLNVSSRGGLA